MMNTKLGTSYLFHLACSALSQVKFPGEDVCSTTEGLPMRHGHRIFESATEQVVYYWVHITRRIMTDPKTKKKIEKARGSLVEGSSLPDLSGEQMKQIEAAFQIFDRRKDGKIDSSEQKARLPAVEMLFL
jgi:hypothetical protein